MTKVKNNNNQHFYFSYSKYTVDVKVKNLVSRKINYLS